MSQSSDHSKTSPESTRPEHPAGTLPLPGESAPELRAVRLDNGQTWDLHVHRPEFFTLIVFYRGLHCPLCRDQLETLDKHMASFTDRGVDVVAISCDDEERAQSTRAQWEIDNVSLMYDLELDMARQWGLFISSAIGDHEPRHFCEPGLFLVDQDGKLFGAWVQSTPFARPGFDAILGALDFVRKKDYPPRGTVAEAA